MTAIGHSSSPLQRLQAQLSSSVSAGTVNAADQDALSGALTDIDSSLSSSRGDGSKNKPGDIKQKVDDLIAQEVASGKLTSDQADELKGVFAQTFSQNGKGAADGASGPGGPGGPGGPRGPGGPGGAGGPPPQKNDDASDDTSTSSTTSASDLLQQFLKTLQNQSASSSPSYSASGASSTSSSSTASLLVNYET